MQQCWPHMLRHSLYQVNISRDTIKALQENIGRKISDIPCSNIFTNISPRAREIKERINQRDHTKLKIFCMAKEYISKMKREQTYGEIYLPTIPQTRVWSPKYIRIHATQHQEDKQSNLKNGQDDVGFIKIVWESSIILDFFK